MTRLSESLGLVRKSLGLRSNAVASAIFEGIKSMLAKLASKGLKDFADDILIFAVSKAEAGNYKALATMILEKQKWTIKALRISVRDSGQITKEANSRTKPQIILNNHLLIR